MGVTDLSHDYKSSTKEISKTLKEMYQKFSTTNNVHLIMQLFNLRISCGKSVDKPLQQHLNGFNMFVGLLNSIDIKFAYEN